MNAQQPIRLTDFISVDVTVERRGAGGFGLIYMGSNRLAGGLWAALKTLRPELMALHPQLHDLFLQECLTWVGLWPHPNLLTALAATTIDRRLFLFLDYAEHGSLRDLLSRDLPFTLRLLWAQHIAAGLVALHTPDPEFLRPLPLVHRDLKPENVLVHASGYAMITDFGLAASVGEALAQAPKASEAFALIEHLAALAHQANPSAVSGQSSRATRTTRFQTRTAGAGAVAPGLGGVGTIAYMPPEQWDVDGKVGPPADLYAFGLILSELLAGRHGLADLEADLDVDGWYHIHRNGIPRPLRTGPVENATRLPQEIEQLYQALLAKRPEDRPTAWEALAVLQQSAAQVGEDPYTPPDVYPRTDHHRRDKWQNWASTYTRFGLWEDALERNERALAIDPQYFHALNIQGGILSELGLRAAGQGIERTRLLKKAFDWFDQAIAAATNDHERALAQETKAAHLTQWGLYDKAEAAYADALAIEPDNGRAWLNRMLNARAGARAEATTGQRAEALRHYEMAESYARQAMRFNPNDPNSHRRLADIQHDRAQLEL